MEILEKFNKEIKEFNKKKEKLVNELKPQFTNLFSEVFSKYNIDAFQFQQYTPYFNDGDTCTFSINDCWTVKLKGGDDFIDAYMEKNKELSDGLALINKILFSIPDDIMLSMFGDHVEITVNSDLTYTVHDYNHD